MRIGELSNRTGVPVPTIKYYLREGLLPAGELTSPNQAQYGETHVRRLKLVRALVEVGKLSIAAAREVLVSIDEPGIELHRLLGTAHTAIVPPVTADRESPAWQDARRYADELIERRGWLVDTCSPTRDAIAQVVMTQRDLGQEDLLRLSDAYATAAEQLAGAEVAAVVDRADNDGRVEGVVLGTVLGEAMLAALRLAAQENASAQAAHGRTAVAGAHPSA
ncbi:MerR family transcriptional regulator [Kitasatospora sp. NPDC004240]